MRESPAEPFQAQEFQEEPEVYQQMKKTVWEPSGHSYDEVINITVHPLGVVRDQAEIGFGFYLTERTFLGVTGHYMYSQSSERRSTVSNLPGDEADYDFYRYGVGLEALLGWTNTLRADTVYSKIGLDYNFYGIEDTLTANEIRYEESALQVLTGYQWMFESGFNLRLGGGYVVATPFSRTQVLDPNDSGRLTRNSLRFNDWGVRFELAMGWAF